MIKLEMQSVRTIEGNDKLRNVILKATNPERWLVVPVGIAEGDATAVGLHRVAVSRPMTHDLLLAFADEANMRLKRVVINDLQDDTFYAQIVVDINGREAVIDSRPSDAFAIAIRRGVPIFVEDEVMDKIGITLDSTPPAPVPVG